jgi:hypothetical protein
MTAEEREEWEIENARRKRRREEEEEYEQLMTAPIWSGRKPERSRASRAAKVATELGVTSGVHIPRVLTPLTRSRVPVGISSRL